MYFWNTQRKIRVFLWIKFLFFLLFINNVHAQANSDYLSSLEDEASGLSLDSQTKNIQKKSSLIGSGLEGQQGGEISDLLPGLSIEKFELLLKSNYIGSYLFYKRLSMDKKEEVYGFYQSNPDPQKVREKILQLSKK